jgi:hypothetical protein
MSDRLQDIPFDFAAADRMDQWRDRFAWPLPHDEIYQMGIAVARGFACLSDEIDDVTLNDIFLLTGPVQTNVMVSLIESAIWLQHCQEQNLRFVGGPREIYILRGETPPDDLVYSKAANAYSPPLRNRLFRRLARTASWTPWHRLPATVLASTSTAINHNSLLRSFARESKERVDYHHADSILDSGRRRLNGKRHRPDFEFLFERIKYILEDCTGLDEHSLSKVMELFVENALPVLENANDMICAARAVPRLPQNLWGGSGGYRPGRALRIEARKRGGTVTGFDHSGTAGFIREVEALAFTELSVSDRFVATTPQMAKVITGSGAHELLNGSADIIGARGDPSFASMLSPPWEGPHSPNRVLYVSASFTGFRQRFPPRIPDVVHLDWQLRLASALSKFPIDLLAQTHPGGLLRGQVHPVGEVAALSNRNFEDVWPWADVFVFDVLQSTTFTLALCSDRPIVMIDHEMNRFGDAVKEMLRRRCSILTVTRDEKNLPQIDFAALEEAVSGPLHQADPTEFRALFAGEFA